MALTTVSGRVTDINGAPMAGVSVTAHGTAFATTTAPDGTYAIEVNEGTQVLVYQVLGFYGAAMLADVPAGGLVDYDANVISMVDVIGILASLGRTIDASKGMVDVSFSGWVGGEAATLSVASDPPFTEIAGTNTVSDVLIAGGEGALTFSNADIGTVVVTVTGALGQTTCTASEPPGGWPVLTQVVTLVEATCSP